LGEFNLWVQHGPSVILAALVSGTPPPELRDLLQRTLERVDLEYRPLLASFNGNATAFAETRPLLDSCLLGRQTTKARKSSRPFLMVAAAALLLAIGLLIFFSVRAGRRWDRLVEQLRQEPGIVVTAADRSWGTYQLDGLRDPLSTDPNELVRASGIDPGKVTSRWEPYVSLDTKLNLLRGFLTEKGALEQAVLRFPSNSVQLAADQLGKLDDIDAHIVKLQEYGAATGQKFSIELHGRADPSGNEDANKALSQTRADEVAKALVSHGISKDVLRTVSLGSREPVRRAAGADLTGLNRCVTFQVVNETEAIR
jgi:OOP family OmpA-OmpF porin